MSNAWQKIKQILSNNLTLNFSSLKISHILHSCYHPKIIGHILENRQNKQAYLYSKDYAANYNEHEVENEK